MKKKNVIPDKMIPTTLLAPAKDKKGKLIRYFGVPVVVNLDKKGMVTPLGVNTRKLVDCFWLKAPEDISEESRAWQNVMLKIDVENESDVQHPIIVLDQRLLKFHLFGMSRKQVHQCIAFYSAQCLMKTADGITLIQEYLSSVADTDAANRAFNALVNSYDAEYTSALDDFCMEILLAASALEVNPKKIHKAISKNEHRAMKQFASMYKYGVKDTKKVQKQEKKATKAQAKATEIVDGSDLDPDIPDDDDLVVETTDTKEASKSEKVSAETKANEKGNESKAKSNTSADDVKVKNTVENKSAKNNEKK